MSHDDHVQSGQDDGRSDAPSGRSVLAFFVVLAVVCIGGYLLLTKLIDMSRQEDCMLAGRRNCAAPLEVLKPR